MGKTLIVCNTYYQLIVATQIAIGLQKEVTLVLTEEMKQVDRIAANAEETGLFHQICVLCTKKKESKVSCLRHLLFGSVPPALQGESYEELIGFNFDIPTHKVFASLLRRNRAIRVNRMEEGLLSYHTPDTGCRILSLAYRLRRLFGRCNLKDRIGQFYCFAPEAYHGNLPTVAIPRIKTDDNRIKEALNRIFVSHEIRPYSEKYIFLSGIYDREGGSPIGELELAVKIADRVGRENLLVKVHPRDQIKRYEAKGLKTDPNSDIPWEVIQINEDFSDKVLITPLSGGILNFNPVMEKVSRSYYGFSLCDLSGNALASHYRTVLEGYLNDRQLALRDIVVLQDIEEISK